MALVACSCTNCGATLEVDREKDAAICQFCGTPFIVEKAINYYKTVNVTMNQKDEDALIRKGKRLVQDINLDVDELYKVGSELSDIATNDFYPEFFLFASGAKDNLDWLIKNSSDAEKKMIVSFLFDQIVRDYKKNSFDEIELNIEKNYRGFSFFMAGNDKTNEATNQLYKLKDSFDSDAIAKWDKLGQMASKELDALSKTNLSSDKVKVLIGYALTNKFVPEDARDSAVAAATSFLKSITYDRSNLQEYIPVINLLLEYNLDVSFFEYKIAEEFYIKGKDIEVKGKKYPKDNALEFTRGTLFGYLLLKISDTEATVVRLSGFTNADYFSFYLDCKSESLAHFTNLADYGSEPVSKEKLKLVYKEGLSYKKNILAKFIGLQ